MFSINHNHFHIFSNFSPPPTKNILIDISKFFSLYQGLYLYNQYILMNLYMPHIFLSIYILFKTNLNNHYLNKEYMSKRLYPFYILFYRQNIISFEDRYQNDFLLNIQNTLKLVDHIIYNFHYILCIIHYYLNNHFHIYS